jgi:hypothetical protein
VGEAVERAVVASGGRKPVLPILQIFAWTATDRYPTSEELKCMVYLSLIHGAHGIGYYSYGTVTGKKGVTFAEDQPVVWNSLKDVNRELAQIGPFLLEAAPDTAVTLRERDSGVELRTVARGDSRLLLLANPTDTAKEIALQFANIADGTWKPIGRGKPLSVAKGAARVKLEPHGTAAFQK